MNKGMVITESDYLRIKNLLRCVRCHSKQDSANLHRLQESLSAAVIVPSKEIPGNVVTMNSTVTVCDSDTLETMKYTLVYPEKSDYRKGCISILAPLGAALIGSRVGEVINWEVPKGLKRMEIREISYQPEANGNMNA